MINFNILLATSHEYIRQRASSKISKSQFYVIKSLKAQMRIQSESNGHMERKTTWGHSGKACSVEETWDWGLTAKDRHLLEQLKLRHNQMPMWLQTQAGLPPVLKSPAWKSPAGNLVITQERHALPIKISWTEKTNNGYKYELWTNVGNTGCVWTLSLLINIENRRSVQRFHVVN